MPEAIRHGDEFYCRRRHNPAGRLPALAPRENRWAPDGQIVFEMYGWSLGADDVWRFKATKHNRDELSVRRARAGTHAIEAGKKLRAQEPAKLYGRRAMSLPFNAACPECRTINSISALATELLNR